ncbi:MAG: 2-hydroxyacyl-CoA dehydratase subunit D [Candidatus Helarchaeota archaeon]
MENSWKDLFEAAGPVPNQWINEWKKTRKVIGFFCSYIPEEIIIAADILPVRMNARGHHDTSDSDGLLSNLNCTFCRYTLDKGLKHQYDFLDGMISYNSCDHVRRTYDNWKYKLKMPFMHFLSIPHHVSDRALKWFIKELNSLKNAIENHFNIQITDEKLNQAIKTMNQLRKVLQDASDLRKEEVPKITGTEAEVLSIAASAMPKKTCIQMVQKAVDECKQRPGIENKPRIMVLGSIIDDYKYIQTIEDMGAIVVTDYNCFGTKYYTNLVKENGSPIEQLAERYLRNLPCPRMICPDSDHSVRLEKIKKFIKEYYVDGVVLESLKFCDLWSGEIYMLIKDLKALGVPTLEVEREYVFTGLGQLKTRVQAFIERL